MGHPGNPEDTCQSTSSQKTKRGGGFMTSLKISTRVRVRCPGYDTAIGEGEPREGEDADVIRP